MHSPLELAIIEECMRQPHEHIAALAYTVGLRIGFVIPRKDVESTIDSLLTRGDLKFNGRWLRAGRTFEGEYHTLREA